MSGTFAAPADYAELFYSDDATLKPGVLGVYEERDADPHWVKVGLMGQIPKSFRHPRTLLLIALAAGPAVHAAPAAPQPAVVVPAPAGTAIISSRTASRSRPAKTSSSSRARRAPPRAVSRKPR